MPERIATTPLFGGVVAAIYGHSAAERDPQVPVLRYLVLANESRPPSSWVVTLLGSVPVVFRERSEHSLRV